MKRIDVRTAYAIVHHAALPSAHHVKFTDAEAALALFNYKGLCWSTIFDSIDGIETDLDGGSVTLGAYANIISGAISSNYAILYKQLIYPINLCTWVKKRQFEVGCRFLADVTSCDLWLIAGGGGEWGVATPHIGFKDINGTLYGTVGDDAAESTLSLGARPVNVKVVLKAIFTPATECRFYIDGVDMGAITTNLPSGTNGANIPLFLQSKTLENVQKYFYASEWRFLQEP